MEETLSNSENIIFFLPTSAIASLQFSYLSYIVALAQQRLSKKLAKITRMRRQLSLDQLSLALHDVALHDREKARTGLR